MNTEHEDDKFEAYLRQFSPREPGPLLKRQTKGWTLRVATLAASAAAAVLAISVFLIGRHHAAPQPILTPQLSPATLGALGRLAREQPDKLDTELESLSPRLLPDVQRSRGVLKDLARE